MSTEVEDVANQVLNVLASIEEYKAALRKEGKSIPELTKDDVDVQVALYILRELNKENMGLVLGGLMLGYSVARTLYQLAEPHVLRGYKVQEGAKKGAARKRRGDELSTKDLLDEIAREAQAVVGKNPKLSARRVAQLLAPKFGKSPERIRKLIAEALK